jgi:hypothetical protein
MANTQSMTTSFMGDLLVGAQQLGAVTLTSRGSLTSPTVDTVKAALYLSSATINAATTAYTVTGEVNGTGYSAGGVTVTNATGPVATNASATAGVAYWTPSASITYTTVTLTTAFNCVLLYNSTQSNKSISVHTFGDQTVTAGTFTLTMPASTTTTALIRLATT